MSKVDIRREKIQRENELLSDLLYHDGWKIVEDSVEALESSLMDTLLVPAKSEWEAVSKEGVLRSINSLRTVFSQIKDRALKYRKEKKLT